MLLGARHRREVELAERLVELVPSAELVAFSNSCSEAVHATLRFATPAPSAGRRLVIKCDGHYDGRLHPVHVRDVMETVPWNFEALRAAAR